MIVIPNSCFSVLFVDEQHYLKNDARVILNINRNEFKDITLIGEWIKLKYRFNYSNKIQSEMFEVVIRVFVSHKDGLDLYKNGFIGISPCGPGFDEYSFLH